jgi:hypothetical protein
LARQTKNLGLECIESGISRSTTPRRLTFDVVSCSIARELPIKNDVLYLMTFRGALALAFNDLGLRACQIARCRKRLYSSVDTGDLAAAFRSHFGTRNC